MSPEPPIPLERRGASLLRVLGLTFGVAVIVGNSVGVGILRTPGEVATQLPDARLFLGVWVVGGLYALLGTNAVAELGALAPQSGGQYVFARRAFGDYAGFVVGWSDWVSSCGAGAAMSIAIGEFAGVLWPALAPRAVALAVLVILAFMALQWRGIRWGSGAQNLTSLLKTIVFLALIAACFVLGDGGAFTGAGPMARDGLTGVTVGVTAATTSAPALLAFVVALQAVIYTYDGWTGIVYFSEEVRDPGRDIPRAMFGGALAVIALYLLVNVALLYVLPLSRMTGASLAAGTAAEALFGARGDHIIRALAIVSLLSSLNAALLIATRVPFAMARDGLFPRRAVMVNRGGTPTASLALSALVAVIFIWSGSFNQVIAALAFFYVANYAVSFAALFVLRRREPNTPRPFRAWGHPWTTALVLVCSLAFLAGAVAADTRHSLYALAVLAASYPVYLADKRLRRAS